MRRSIVVVLALLWVAASAPARAARPYRGGVVATGYAPASEAALEILDKGGNAVDAAVAAAFAAGVVGPYHSGLGGGGFALVFDQKTGETKVLDFREVAPLGATRDLFVKNGAVVRGLSTDGALSVAVPGAVLGYLTLHQKYGRLPRATVMAPAIRLAKQGFWVTPKYRAMARVRQACLQRDPEATRIFLGKDGAVPEVGAIIQQPDLAKTLTAIARQGPSAFYRGRIAQAIATTVKRHGGVLSEEDLKKYEVRWRAPLEGHYRGHTVLTMPPPSAGGIALLQVLAAMERMEPQPPARWHDTLHLHRFVEAVRRVYVDRAKYLGDPAFTDIPLQRLLSPEYIDQMVKGIDPDKATPSTSLLDVGAAATQSTLVPHPEGARSVPAAPMDGTDAGRNTTHISIVDREGNAVAMTTTINYGFGSCLVAAGTGVLLNDEMDDFAAQVNVPNAYGLVTGEANAIAPGKIPLSSMSPTIVFQKENPKKVLLVVGSPGGSTIPTTVMQVIENVIDYGMDVLRAAGAPRVHHQYLPDALMIDTPGLEPQTRQALSAKGHHLQDAPTWGDAEAVYVDPQTGLRYAGSDPRNEGAGVGQD